MIDAVDAPIMSTSAPAIEPTDGKMRVLVVGGGAREHALVLAIRRSSHVREVLAMPGNAGIAAVARCVEGRADDVDAIVATARAERIDLVVIGPEAPLVAGVVDALTAAGILAFGPTKQAARLEGSKAFCKEFMRRHGIATSDFAVFDDVDAATAHLRRAPDRPLVVKADGLAAGKGVVVAETIDEACAAVNAMIGDRVFGDAGARVVLEERVRGVELSFHAICDGERFVALAAAQDHKRIGEGDTGPNTGGMGAYSPPEFVTPELHQRVLDEVIAPAVRGMQSDGAPFRGALFAGLMIGEPDAAGVRALSVLEFNVRFGDPETAVLLARLDGDVVPLLVASARGDLSAFLAPNGTQVALSPEPALAVVLAAAGYPGAVASGDPIDGLRDAASDLSVTVLHAGTTLVDDAIVSAGGRVLCVTARGATIDEAADRVYRALAKIRLRGGTFRRDIAARARNPRRATGSA